MPAGGDFADEMRQPLGEPAQHEKRGPHLSVEQVEQCVHVRLDAQLAAVPGRWRVPRPQVLHLEPVFDVDGDQERMAHGGKENLKAVFTADTRRPTRTKAYLNFGAIPACLQISLAVIRSNLVCLLTGTTLVPFVYMEWLPPYRRRRMPLSIRYRMRSRRLTDMLDVDRWKFNRT